MSSRTAPHLRRSPTAVAVQRVEVDAAARDHLVDRLIAEASRTHALPRAARTTDGYVRTPDELADLLCAPPHHDMSWLPAGARVLEPSAGDGALVAAILRANPLVTVTAVEPDPIRAAVCTANNPVPGGGVPVHVSTFENYASAAILGHVQFDGVVMNPPFSLPGQADVWFEHLRLAWQLLRPGGRLVAVVPSRFTHRSSSTHRDARQFVEHHGSHELLPGDAFAPSQVSVDTRVVRLTKPLSTSSPEYLLSINTATEPLRVNTPALTAAAVTNLPVQVWYSGWTGADRVLRYRGRCLLCRWLLWGFDDGENDPRGILGNFSAGVSLTAQDHGLNGPPVGLCCACGSDGDRYHAALARARTHWTQPAAAPAGI